MRDATDVAHDICKLMWLFTDYITQIRLTNDGVLVKVGNTANEQAGIVNVSKHWDRNNNLIQDKFLAVKLAYRLYRYLKSTK